MIRDKEHALAAAQIIEQWSATALRCDAESRPVGRWKSKDTGEYIGVKPEEASSWLVEGNGNRLGVIPGSFNRLCIDVDTHKINPSEFLQSKGFPEPVLVTDSIGGKGTHAWYLLPDGVQSIGNGNWGDASIGEHYGELRGHKGYVVEKDWSEVLHADWDSYEPLDNVVNLVKTIKINAKPVDIETKGTRNNTLNFQLYTGFLNDGDAFIEKARQLCRDALDNGLPVNEIKATLASARRSAQTNRARQHTSATQPPVEARRSYEKGTTYASGKASKQLNINPFVDLPAVEETADKYLMEYLFQRGAIMIVFGEGSHGKSTVARDILARVQHSGNTSLTGKVKTTQLSGLKTMYYSGEETDTGQLKRRLRASGIDVEDKNFKLVDSAFDWNDRLDKTGEQSQLTTLLKFIERDKTDLFVIDSVSSLSLGDTSNPETVERIFRDILSPIINTGCSVVLIAHPRKDNWQGRMLDSLKGSERWSTLARAVYVCASASKDMIDLNNAGNELYWSKVVSDMSERVGCISPLKLNNIPESKQRAYHFEILSDGTVEWSDVPYSPAGCEGLQGQHRSFGERVAYRYKPNLKGAGNATQPPSAASIEQMDKMSRAVFDYLSEHAGCKISEIIANAVPGAKNKDVSRILERIGACSNDYGWVLPVGSKPPA